METVVNLFNNNVSQRKIALRLSISTHTVARILKSQGHATDKRERNQRFKEFNGKRYTFEPRKGYYRCQVRSQGRTYLHRDIFEHFHGRKIKEGFHVDHIDNDNSNNDPKNLQELEPDENSRKMQRWNGHPAQS